MGVTIHFEERLLDRAAMTDLLQFARRFASDRGWVTDEVNETNAKLLRVDENERDCDYLGPTVSFLSRILDGAGCEVAEKPRLADDSNRVVDKIPIDAGFGSNGQFSVG
jgi:hypothetical protein